MRLDEAQALLDEAFLGMEEGAARMYEPGDASFAARLSAVWLEYRWYVHGRGLAEVFVKWKRVEVEACAGAEVSVLRIHLLGRSEELARRAERVLEVGEPAPERLLDVFGADGVERRCVAAGPMTVTVEQWPSPSPVKLLARERFQALAGLLVAPEATGEQRREAVEDLCAEYSPRVVEALLAGVERRPVLAALRRLSEWGVVGALGPLEKALGALEADAVADLWALTALKRRLEAWAAAGAR